MGREFASLFHFHGIDYPHEKPTIQIISMDIPEEEKKRLQESLLAACEDCMGMAMTYVLSSTLGTLLTDWHEDSLAKVKAGSVCIRIIFHVQSVTAEVAEETVVDTSSLKSTSSEVKTKAQKRREQNGWEKVGERPRGWNWVDVMSHLRKTANTDCYVCFIRNGDVSHYIINDVFISIKSKVNSNYNAIRTEYYGSILEYNTVLASIKVL